MVTSPKGPHATTAPKASLPKSAVHPGKIASSFVIDSAPKLIFLKPEVALKEAHLKPGDFVADLGCGGGFLTIPAAVQVGAQGLVYAVDILKDNLAQIRSQAKLYNLPNVQTVWADLEIAGSTGIPNGNVDVTLLFKVLCQQKNHEAIFGEAVRVTKPGGLILVAEWCEPELPSNQARVLGKALSSANLKPAAMGPGRENLVTRQELLNLGKKVGLLLEKEHKLDDFHYVLEYRRPDGTTDQRNK